MEGWQVVVLSIILIVVDIGKGEAQLSDKFYSTSCPNVESLVQQAVLNKFKQTDVTAQATLRLFFHDCFVQGCDASIMIQSPNGDAEKDAPDNLSLAGDGFDTVMKAKQVVEAQCPGIVSCADILALAARDVIVITGGPSFRVELGRRDGLVSEASDVAGNLPEPSFNLTQLVAIFSKNNLTQFDMIALSGARTIGVSHCSRFADRLYKFSAPNPVDPSLNSTYAKQLMQACPKSIDPRVAVPMDPQTPMVFDNLYYQNLVEGKGMFTSDKVLITDTASRATVISFAKDPMNFTTAFIAAIQKLGRVGVKTGNEGEIRKDCSAFNSR